MHKATMHNCIIVKYSYVSYVVITKAIETLACNIGQAEILTYIHKGGSRRGANHSSGSLKQGVWGAAPPEGIGYFVL